MKPEPLTKEKIREAFEKWYFSKPLIPHGLMWTEHSYEGFKAGVEFMKQRVEWLLKEIENEERYALKMIEKKHRTNYFSGVRNAFIVAKCLIKKAFEGVLRE